MSIRVFVTFPAVCLALLFATQLSIAQVVSPGAVEPQIAPEDLRAVEEDLIKVPTVSDRPVDANAGPALEVNRFALRVDHIDKVDPRVLQDAQQYADRFLESNGSMLTIGQLESVARGVTDLLRDSGLMLAQAILPAQDVEQGVVQIRVLPGLLGAVLVENNEKYRGETIRYRLDSMVDEPVSTSVIESTVLRLNDMPGFRSAAVFNPGVTLGETRLTVKVEEEDPVEYFAQVDNYGVESTGEVRLLLGADVNNISGNIDRLAVNAVQTFSAGDLRFGSASYEVTHPNLVHTFGLAYSKTDYDVERRLRALGINGETDIGEVYLRSQWIRQRNNNLATTLGLASKRARVKNDAGFSELAGKDKLTVLNAGLVYDGVDTRFRGLHRATLNLRHGFNNLLGSMDSNGDFNSLRRGASLEFAAGKFDKVSATYTRLQSVVTNHSVLFRFAGQHSDDLLSSLEQMSLGGPYTVRAYPVSEYVRDTAVFTSLAWVINGSVFSEEIAYDDYSWGEVLSVLVFFDYGWGETNDARLPVPLESGETKVDKDISGAGIEFELNFPGYGAFARASVAAPVTSVDAANDEDFQYWLSVGANF